MSSNLKLRRAVGLAVGAAGAATASLSYAPTALAADAAVGPNAETAPNDQLQEVIVTGTRVQGMTAADSAAPITVLGTDALTKGTGSTDLRQALEIGRAHV